MNPIEMPECCITRTNDSQIKFEENGKKLVFINEDRQECKKIQVDGCVIKDEDKSCDGLLIDAAAAEYYVELKGADVSRAVEQLRHSINVLHKDDAHQVVAFIIAKKFCPEVTTKIQNFQKELKTKYKGKLVRAEIQCKYSLKKRCVVNK